MKTVLLSCFLFLGSIVETECGSESNMFSNDVLRFLKVISSCTKHIHIDDYWSDVLEFEKYYDELLRSKTTGPSIITLNSFYERYYNLSHYMLHKHDYISSVSQQANCFTPIFFISRINALQHFANLNALEYLNLYESPTLWVYVTGWELDRLERQIFFQKKYFPLMDRPIVEIYNNSQLNMMCMHCSN